MIFELSYGEKIEQDLDVVGNSQKPVDVLNQAVCGLFVIQDRLTFESDRERLNLKRLADSHNAFPLIPTPPQIRNTSGSSYY